jgi:D-amino-acid dehydrogenase
MVLNLIGRPVNRLPYQDRNELHPLENSPTSHSDVLVIGGGVIGMACAYYLIQSGKSVRIIEQDTIGAGASHGNCGLIFVSDLPPLCSPGAIRKELGRLVRGTSPLRIKLRPDLPLYLWLLRFAAFCNKRHLRHSIGTRGMFLGISNDLLNGLISREKLDCDFDRRGILMVFTDPDAMEDYTDTNRLMEPYGLAAEFLDRDQIHRLEPALNENVCGGWHHRADSHLRPDTLMAAWHRNIQRQGVRIIENCRFKEFEVRNGKASAARTTTGRFTADQFVLAAGAWTTALGHQLDLHIPVQPGKGYSITMARPAVCPSTPCYLYERNMVVTPWQSGYRLGGTMEFSGFNHDLDRQRLENLKTSAARYMRTPVGQPVTEEWTGLRPMCADDLPIIDRTPNLENVIVATGHGMLGLTTATGTGLLVADMIMERRPAFDPRPFSIKRFS